jgi:hypothetical protein
MVVKSEFGRIFSIPWEGLVPVRKIPISYSSVTGRYVLPDGSTVGFESTLERDFITLMIFDPAFVTMEEQPVRICFADKLGKRRRYTPDFLVTYVGKRPMLAEVKPAKHMTPEMEASFEAGRAYSKDNGWDFKVWTDVEMRTPFLRNVKFLVPYRSRETNPGIEARLLRELERLERTSIAELLEVPGTARRVRPLDGFRQTLSASTTWPATFGSGRRTATTTA